VGLNDLNMLFQLELIWIQNQHCREKVYFWVDGHNPDVIRFKKIRLVN